MATTKDYKDYVLDQLKVLNNITSKPMMGEYLLYYNEILFGGIYDNQLLIKVVDSNKKYHLSLVIPYQNAKPMYLIDNMDNSLLLKNIIGDTCNGLIKNK